MSNSRRARRALQSIQWPASGQIIAAILARVSLDKDGKGKSTDSQVKENKAVCAEFFWTVAESDIYIDNSISASEFTDKERPAWLRLRSAVRSGRLHVVIAWEASRLSRSLKEGLEFMEECMQVGTRIHITVEERTFDLGKYSDWKALRNLFIDAENESHKHSDRLNRAQKTDRSDGKQNGICPFGLKITYVEAEPGKPPKPVREISEEQAKVVREIIGSIAVGDSVSRVVTELNRRDVPPPSKRSKYGMWTRATVTGIARNPVYISKITRKASYGIDRDLNDLVDAPQYPRIIEDDAMFFAAVKNLTRAKAADRTGSRLGAAAHLLTRIAVCGTCGGVITPGNRTYKSAAAPAAQPGTNAVKGKKGFQALPEGTIREKKVTRYYRCAKKMDVNVPETEADQYISVLVIDKLCELCCIGGFSGRESAELIAARSEEAAARKRIEDATEQYNLDRISAETLGTIESKNRPLIGELQQRQRQLSVPASLYPFMSCDGDPELVAKTWHGLTLEGRRTVLRELAESITLHPAKHAGRGQAPVAERIEVTWNPVYIVSGDTAKATESGQAVES
jgi:DNA invertase Pin-like site-specific DNA recombinase